MDFEKAYQKFLDGTATEEEIEFVRSEMKRASAVSDVMENVRKDGVTTEAEEGKVKKAIKKYNMKTTVKIISIVLCCLIVFSAAVGASIAIPIVKRAKENTKLSKAQAQEIAISYVLKEYPQGAEKIKVRKIEKDLEVYGRIKTARYVYVIDVYNGVDNVMEIEIDGKTGEIIEADID